jgi:hypothetical protein
MKNLRAWLEQADPVRDEPALPTTNAREIRRAMLGASETPLPLFFPRTLPVAALVVVTIVAGATAGRRLSSPAAPQSPVEAAGIRPESGERRQVQFATPGGTRIIWTIDPDFQMREVMP